MDFNKLIEKRNYVNDNLSKLDSAVIENYEKAFAVDFTHNSTAIEGNNLTLMETKLLLEDKLTVGGKDLREQYEVTNHGKAWEYVKTCVNDEKSLSEDILKELHALIMENIMVGGIYRTVEVKITGAEHTPPHPEQAYNDLKNFYISLEEHNYNDLEISAYTHAEFVKIHPFVDGNGRISRIIMNYQLLKQGFLPISIKKEDRFKYYETLDEYAVKGNLEPFTKIIYDLEEEQLDFYIKAIKDTIGKE